MLWQKLTLLCRYLPLNGLIARNQWYSLVLTSTTHCTELKLYMLIGSACQIMAHILLVPRNMPRILSADVYQTEIVQITMLNGIGIWDQLWVSRYTTIDQFYG